MNSKLDDFIADSLESIGTVAGKAWDGFVAYQQGPKSDEPKDMQDAIAQMSRMSPF
jgi:hypothetical protein